MTYLKTQISNNRHLLLAILILILLRIPSLFEGFWYGDEGIYAAIAEGLHRGQILYTDVWDHKPPLLYWLYYLVSFGGNWHISLALIKLLGIVASVVSLVLLREILRKLFSGKLAIYMPLYAAALLFGLPYLEPNTANAEIFFIPVNLAILLLLLKRARPTVIGLLLGVSLLLKFHSFFEASLVIFVISLLHQYGNKQPWSDWLKWMLHIAFGLSIIIIPYLGYTALQGNTADMLNATLWYNLGYTDDARSSLQIFNINLSSSKLVLAAASLLLATIYYAYRRSKIDLALGLVLVVLISEYAAVIVSGRPYAHYSLQAVAGVVLLIGYALQQQSLLVGWRKYLPIVIVLLVTAGLWLGFTRGYKLASLVTPQDYYPKFIQSFVWKNQTKSFDWRYRYDIPRFQQLASHINTNYPDKQSYYFYGNRAWLFTQIDKDFTNTYVVWFHVDQDPAKDQADRQAADLLIVDPEIEHANRATDYPQASWQLQENFQGIEIYTKANE